MATTDQPTAEQTPADDIGLAQAWASLESGARASRGIYSVYKTPEGGLHIAFRPEGLEEDQHIEIPGRMMNMMISASEGKGPLGMLRGMMQG